MGISTSSPSSRQSGANDKLAELHEQITEGVAALVNSDT